MATTTSEPDLKKQKVMETSDPFDNVEASGDPTKETVIYSSKRFTMMFIAASPPKEEVDKETLKEQGWDDSLEKRDKIEKKDIYVDSDLSDSDLSDDEADMLRLHLTEIWETRGFYFKSPSPAGYGYRTLDFEKPAQDQDGRSRFYFNIANDCIPAAIALYNSKTDSKLELVHVLNANYRHHLHPQFWITLLAQDKSIGNFVVVRTKVVYNGFRCGDDRYRVVMFKPKPLPANQDKEKILAFTDEWLSNFYAMTVREEDC